MGPASCGRLSVRVLHEGRPPDRVDALLRRHRHLKVRRHLLPQEPVRIPGNYDFYYLTFVPMVVVQWLAQLPRDQEVTSLIPVLVDRAISR